jgi:hypothetical protein
VFNDSFIIILLEIIMADFMPRRTMSMLPTEPEPTALEPTELEPTELEPTALEPTELEPTALEPIEPEPPLARMQSAPISASTRMQSAPISASTRMQSAPIRASTRMTTCGGDPCGADEPPMSPVNSDELKRF